MTHFKASGLALSTVLLAASFALVNPAKASAHPHPEKIKIIPGLVTAKPNRGSRTIVEVERFGNEIIIERRVINLDDTELRGGPRSKNKRVAGRVTTGQSPETVMNGVRVINVRRNLRGK